MAIDLSKQQALNTNQKSIQHINFTGNLEQTGNQKMLLIIDEVKKNYFGFLTRVRNDSIQHGKRKIIRCIDE